MPRRRRLRNAAWSALTTAATDSDFPRSMPDGLNHVEALAFGAPRCAGEIRSTIECQAVRCLGRNARATADACRWYCIDPTQPTDEPARLAQRV